MASPAVQQRAARDLAVLVTRPGERTHVSELAGATGLPGSDLGPVADRRALAAYRERLRRIDAEFDSLGHNVVRSALAAACGQLYQFAYLALQS